MSGGGAVSGGGDVSVEAAALCTLARQAGAAVMEIYRSAADSELRVDHKSDDSPLTAADRSAHHLITAGLRKLYPDIPVISEEGAEVPYEERKDWERFFLVDPLDGTKEFISRNGEFTVNIALMQGRYPALGTVYAPALDRLYYGGEGLGAWRQEAGQAPEEIGAPQRLPGGGHEAAGRQGASGKEQGLVVAVSRSHPSPELEEYLAGLSAPVKERISAGSSLKFCLVAEGRADLYPRLGPTMEWDTAAGQAVVEGAGGEVLGIEDGVRKEYGSRDLRNRGFTARNGGSGVNRPQPH